GQCGNQIGSCLLPEILQEYDVRLNNEGNSRTKRDKIDLQQFMSSFFNFKSKYGTFDTLADLIKSKAKARDLEITGQRAIAPMDQNINRKFLKPFSIVLNIVIIYMGSCCYFLLEEGPDQDLELLLSNYLQIITPPSTACVYPTGIEDVITCPYNMAFATQELLNSATCVFPIENCALLDIALRQTNRYDSSYKHISLFKPFEDMNSIIVDMVLHLTSGSRFGGKMNIDINEINTNMVPFPKLNFLTSGFSPFSFKRSTLNTSGYTAMSATLLGRGNYSVNDMRSYIDKLKTKLHFASWSDKAIKVGLCNVAPKEILSQFMKLYNRKVNIYTNAYTHHYTTIPGFDYDHFEDCQNSLNDIIQLYRDIERIKPAQ
ncbi:tubulin epsilon chain, partial [Asbolus verrucosus]